MYAIYRCLYGEDFVQQSINSILDVVDKVLVVWDDKVWGDVDGCSYKGEYITYPKKFDNIIEKVEELNSPKIILHKDHVFSPFGHHQHIIENILPIYGNPDDLMIIEVDMVFRNDQLKLALDEFYIDKGIDLYLQQIEIWKMKYRIPERDRPGVQLVHRKTGKTNSKSSALVHNFGFSFSDKTMYWKHLTAIGFSNVIRDSPPNVDWYDNKWLKWHPIDNNQDLEISIGAEKNIPYAFEYPENELPETIRNHP